MVLKGYFFSIIFGIFCIGLSGVLYNHGLKSEYTRKVTHILIGFEWVILYQFFGITIHFFLVCLIFLILLLVSNKTNIFPQLSSKKENDHGTVYYGLAMSVMGLAVLIVPKMIIPFGIGVFCTSFGDGFAAIFGRIEKYNHKIWENKTFFGSISCFVFSFMAITTITRIYDLNISVFQAFCIALFATELEVFAVNGIDNVTVTIGVSLLSYLFAYHSNFTSSLVAPILLTLPMIMFVIKTQALTKWGIAFALILDIVVSMAFGNVGFFILILFFVGSLLSDKVKKTQASQKTEQRTVSQVLANGLIGGISALLYIFFRNKILFLIFATSFAEAFADTVASGVGSIAKKAYDPFRMCYVKKGISGGMSLIGTVASLGASISVGLLSLCSNEVIILDAGLIAFSGFLGAIFDSFVGSCVQIKYICRKCGLLVEEKSHCNQSCIKYSGYLWIDNNIVNFISILFSSLVVSVLFMVIN